MKDLKLNVEGMHCKSCEILIADELEETGSISEISVSVENGTVSCKYDSTKISEEEIKEIISNEGYKVQSTNQRG